MGVRRDIVVVAVVVAVVAAVVGVDRRKREGVGTKGTLYTYGQRLQLLLLVQ